MAIDMRIWRARALTVLMVSFILALVPSLMSVAIGDETSGLARGKLVQGQAIGRTLPKGGATQILPAFESGSGVIVSVAPRQVRTQSPCRVAEDELDPGCLVRERAQCPPRTVGGEAGQWVRYTSAPAGLSDPTWSEQSFAPGGVDCLYGVDPQVNAIEVIAGLVARELQTRQIAAAKFGVQPSPNTLRGVSTNFFAVPATQSFRMSLLGLAVTMVVYPVSNTFNYGDGSKLGPTSLTGVELVPDKWGEETPTSHVYQVTGDYTASVTTTFRGTFSVNGGPAMPITGEANVTSPGVRVSVWKTKVDWYSNPGDKK